MDYDTVSPASSYMINGEIKKSVETLNQIKSQYQADELLCAVALQNVEKS